MEVSTVLDNHRERRIRSKTRCSWLQTTIAMYFKPDKIDGVSNATDNTNDENIMNYNMIDGAYDHNVNDWS